MGGVNCRISDISEGIPKVISLLENLNATSVSTKSILHALESTLRSQEGLQNLTNILLKNGTASADEVASIIPEIFKLLQDEVNKQEVCSYETTGLLQSELEIEQDNYEALTQISLTLTRIAAAQTRDSNALSQLATTEAMALDILTEMTETQMQNSNTLAQIKTIQGRALTALNQISQTQSQLSNTFNTVANLLEMQSQQLQTMTVMYNEHCSDCP